MLKGNRILLWMIIIIFAGTACNLFAGRIEPTPTDAALPQLNEQNNLDAQEENQKTPSITAPSKKFEYTVSEDELNKIVSNELAKQDQQLLSDPQINLMDGKIIVTGIVQQSGFSLETEIELVPAIDSSGLPYIEVVSMSVGPFSVPQDFQDEITSTVNDLIITQLINSEVDLQVDSITITENQLTITGSNR